MEIKTTTFSRSFSKLPGLLFIAVLVLFSARASGAEPAASTKENFVRAVLSEDVDEQVEILKKLALAGDATIQPGLAAWRLGSLYIYETNNVKTPFMLDTALDSDGKAKG